MTHSKPSNQQIANHLDQIAELLGVQDANIHRIRAYRNGAQNVRNYQESIAEMVYAGKEDQLQEIQGIGQGLARVIQSFVQTGRSDVLDRLQGEVSPEDLFVQVPGIGDAKFAALKDSITV